MLEYTSLSLSTFIAVRLEQYLKASGLMLVVVLVMLMVWSASHFKKASLSICSTFLGMLMLVMPQSAKAPSPIFSISASGLKVTVFRLVHPMKALASIIVTDLGILNDSSNVRLANTSFEILFSLQSPLKLKAFNFLLVLSALPAIWCKLEPAGTLTTSRFSHM